VEHAPIYQSTSRRTNSSLIPWQRTASLASAAAALTMSGIALGYHSFTATAAPTQPTEVAATPTGVAEGTLGAPVPTISIAIADGGHPDVISAISTALTTHFPASQAQIVAELTLGQLVQPVLPLPVFGPPAATQEPFVVPANLVEPLPAATDQPPDEAAPANPDDVAAPDNMASADALASADLNRGPVLVASAGAQTVATADAPPSADDVQSAPDPETAPIVAQPEPTPAPAPQHAAAVAPIAPPAPKLVATPEPEKPVLVPTPAKLERVPLPDEPQIDLRRSGVVPLPGARQDDQARDPAPHSQPAKPGKGKGSNHGGD